MINVYRGELNGQLIDIRVVPEQGFLDGYPKMWHVALNGYFVSYYCFNGRAVVPYNNAISQDDIMIIETIVHIWADLKR